MKKKRAFCGLAFAVACASFGVSAGDGVVLTPGRTEVLIAPDAPKTVQFAAIDLTNHLTRIFGAEVPVVTVPREGFTQVVLGDSTWTRAAGLDVSKLPLDSFYLKSAPGRLYVAGYDDPKDDLIAQFDRGNYPRSAHATAFGVCEILERYAGVRFYFPDEYGTIIPKAKEIAVPAVNEVVKPQFTIRNCYINGAGPLPDVPIGPGQLKRKVWWQLRLRENTINIPCCHGQNRFRISDRFVDTHPEYFQLRADGTRNLKRRSEVEHGYQAGQLCHTSPVWDIFRKETLERIQKGEKYVDIMPQDGMQACRCANCLKRYSQTNDLSLASGYCSELMWSNTISVAKAITDAGLKGAVTQMAYGPCRHIPSFDIPENVKVILAVGGPWSLSHPDIFEKQIAFIREWSEKLKGKVSWIWTYPMKNYGRLQAHGVPQYAPRAFFKFYRASAPYIDGSYVESNQEQDTIFYNYMNYYMFAQLAWHPDLNMEQVLAEHNRLLFGSAAAPVAKFLDRLEEIWIGKVAIPSLIGETEIGPMIFAPKEDEILRDIYTWDVVRELEGDLDAAVQVAPAGSPEAMRVATLRRRFLGPLVAAKRKFDSANENIPVKTMLERQKASAQPSLIEGLKWQPNAKNGVSIDKTTTLTGEGALRIDATARVYHGLPVKSIVSRLKPGGKYRLSCFVKTEGLERLPDAKGRHGATIEFEEIGKEVKYRAHRAPSKELWNGTMDWCYQSFDFTMGYDVYKEGFRPMIWVRVLGAKGTVWFDGIRLEEVPAYEPGEPELLAKKITSRPYGLSGSFAPLERITVENAQKFRRNRVWRGSAWRNERVNAQIVVCTDSPAKNLRCEIGDLFGPKGARIPASAITARFVRKVLASANYRTGEAQVNIPYHTVGDLLDPAPTVDLVANGYRPVWLQVRVPENAAPSLYKGKVKMVADGLEELAFHFELTVRGRTLPPPAKWAFFLDLWQSPANVARRYGVEPWSPAHWKALEPLMRELGDSGQKTITVQLQETPRKDASGRWRALILRTKRRDGTWAFDYSIFDEWVAFAKRCGLGPQIHCYTVAQRRDRNHHTYIDEATGREVTVKVPIKTEENTAYWHAFLKDFAAHLKAKGWLEDTYMALDENSLEDTKFAVDMIRSAGQGFKVAFACDRPAKDFLAIGIENFSQALRGQLMDADFLAAVKERAKDPKLVTTYYICNFPQKPNSWVTSPLCESAWTGLYAAAKGYTGLLRWAAWWWSSNVDPLWDASCPPRYDAGENFLIYPHAYSSTRWEVMRDSIENAEKIRILRAEGKSTPALEKALAAVDFTPMPKNPDAATRASFEQKYREQVKAVHDALQAIR